MTERMQPIHWLAVFASAAMFGSSFLFVKLATADVPPLTITAARVALAAPLVWGFLRLIGGRLPPLGRPWLTFVAVGLGTGGSFGFAAWGQLHIDSGLGGILFATIPVFVVVLAALLGEERFSATRLVAAVTGVAGVALVIGPQAFAGLADETFGAAVTVAGALSMAVGATLSRRERTVSPIALAAGQLIVASAVLVPVAVIVDRPWALAGAADALGPLVAAAVIGTAAPMVLIFWLIRAIGASRAALAPLMMPVAAVVIGAAVLGEALPWLAYGGLAVILAAAVVMNRAPATPSQPPPATLKMQGETP